ncbi:MAG: dihydropteroate synthase [Fusobacterium sp.]|nr:dihydropteroate synthase [Fusobacterium sp.]
MKDFLVKEIINADLENEIKAIGFESTYAARVVDKYEYKNLKIFALNAPQANILKQTALSLGADCATHREVITGKIDTADCILGGSVSTLRKIAAKLENQPFGLKFLKDAILAQLDKKPMHTQLVGILNLTQNSFSDGGLYYDFDAAKEKFLSLIEDGADIIDIGAESTKPFAQAVSAEAQLEKLMPILDFAHGYDIKISIDTRSAVVADEVLRHGNYIINDVSGLDYDEKMVETIARHSATVIIQHSKGTPETMQIAPAYENLMDEIFLSLSQKIKTARAAGIQNIILDPGIGFGKTAEHNVEIINRIAELKSLGCPIMLGASRKSFLGVSTDDNELKDTLTLAYNAIAIQSGVDFLRVHNVKLHKEFLKTYSPFC